MSLNTTHGVVTNDFKKARNTLIQIAESRGDAKHCSLSMNHMEFNFENGEKWVWVRPINMSRGYRLSSAMFDRNLTFEEFRFVLLQNCSMDFDGYEWI